MSEFAEFVATLDSPSGSGDSGRYGRVVVVYGGEAAERDVSLVSGKAVVAGLLEVGVDAVGLDYRVDGGIDQLRELNPDIVFVAIHGRGGEDGTLQGMLEHLQIPYTGSGVLGSALCMDKLRTKRLWRGCGLPTPDFAVSTECADSHEIIERLGLPLFVKPAREGSSVGMSKVNSAEELEAALAIAKKYDSDVLIEKFVKGAEYTAAVIDVPGGGLPLVRIATSRDFYDYTAKYESSETGYHVPCGLSSDAEQALIELSRKAFDTAGATGWGRVDLMVDEQLGPQLIEVNTVPGMTSHSLVPMAAQAAGATFEQLLLAILESGKGSQCGSAGGHDA